MHIHSHIHSSPTHLSIYLFTCLLINVLVCLFVGVFVSLFTYLDACAVAIDDCSAVKSLTGDLHRTRTDRRDTRACRTVTRVLRRRPRRCRDTRTTEHASTPYLKMTSNCYSFAPAQPRPIIIYSPNHFFFNQLMIN